MSPGTSAISCWQAAASSVRSSATAETSVESSLGRSPSDAEVAADLGISRESNSTAWLTDLIWAAAQRLRRREFLDRETAIEDDHLPFLEAGVSAVDIIDLEYPAWHTAGDTLDKVSAQSLQAVGDVLLAALPDIEKRLLKP